MIDDQKTFETQLMTNHPKLAAIPVEGGDAYFRRPTPEEWEEMQSLRENADGTTNRTPYLRLVHQCFVGAWIGGKQSQDTLDAIAEREGPAFIGGPCGAVVNKLAGTGDRQARFLG